MPLPAPFVRTVPEQTALVAVSSEHSVITLTATPGIPGIPWSPESVGNKTVCILHLPRYRYRGEQRLRGAERKKSHMDEQVKNFLCFLFMLPFPPKAHLCQRGLWQDCNPSFSCVLDFSPWLTTASFLF